MKRAESNYCMGNTNTKTHFPQKNEKNRGGTEAEIPGNEAELPGNEAEIPGLPKKHFLKSCWAIVFRTGFMHLSAFGVHEIVKQFYVSEGLQPATSHVLFFGE